MTQISSLTIMGCGYGDFPINPLLHSADVVIARDSLAKQWLIKNKIKCDYQIHLNEDQIIENWISKIAPALHGKQTAYVSACSPLIIDQVGHALTKAAGIENTRTIEGQQLINLLDPQPLMSQTFVTLDGLSLRNRHHPPFSADQNVFIYDPSAIGHSQMQYLLNLVYALQDTAYIFLPQTGWVKTQIADLDCSMSHIFIPVVTSDQSLESFQEVIAHLRAPDDGCPWDRKQTHTSLRKYLLEETYEALDALDKNDLEGLREELGDILLQILLHAQIASEASEFTMADVVSGITRKIIFRHPHVFKDWIADTEKEVIQNWESLKEQERKQKGKEERKGMLDGVPVSFPGLAQAQALQDRAARVGFDWPEITPVVDKVMEELEEVKSAPDEIERAKEFGDLLFAVVNLIRWYKIDAESALRQTNLKFRKRFSYIEDQARLAGRDLKSMSLEEMDAFWEAAKQFDD